MRGKLCGGGDLEAFPRSSVPRARAAKISGGRGDVRADPPGASQRRPERRRGCAGGRAGGWVCEWIGACVRPLGGRDLEHARLLEELAAVRGVDLAPEAKLMDLRRVDAGASTRARGRVCARRAERSEF